MKGTRRYFVRRFVGALATCLAVAFLGKTGLM